MSLTVKGLPSIRDLENLARWVSWRPSDSRKIPFRPDGHGKASATDSQTWGTRAQAAACQLQVDAPCGVGIVLGPVAELGCTLAGIDLDACRDPDSGWLSTEADDVIRRFGSYAEISPSRRGVKILFLIAASDLPAIERIMGGKAGRSFSRGQHDEIAVHIRDRYFAVTDDVIQWRDEINFVGPETIRWLIKEAGPSFAAGRGVEKPRDKSRSGRAFRLAQQIQRDGGSLLDFEEALADDSELLAWARDSRQVLRAWRRSKPDNDVVERLNQRFALVRHDGRTLIAQQRDDGGFDLGSVEHFHSYLANDRIEADDKKIPASVIWMQSPERRTYESLVFDPSGRAPDDALNLWRGFAVAPDSSATCKLILQHIQEIICAGSERLNRYVLGWLAHLVQRPAEKPGVALVLRGGKGAGKDTLAQILRPIIGRHYAHSDKPDALTAKFNSDLATALLIHVEEAFWAGDRSKQGTLQSLITAPTMRLERKGVDAFTVDSFCRILMTTNHDWAVPATHDERRYCVLDVSDSRIGKTQTYFKPLYAEIKGDGPAGFLHYLLTYDLTEFETSAVPQTAALLDQKIETLRGLDKWWHGLLAAGALPTRPFDDTDWTQESVTLDRDTLRNSFDAWLRDNRFQGESLDATRFGQRLRKLVPDLLDRRGPRKLGRPYLYVIPSLGECRLQFADWIGGTPQWN